MTSPSSQADPRSLADDGLSPYTAAILREASRGLEGPGRPRAWFMVDITIVNGDDNSL
jgi:hypothetical protein